MRENKLDFFVVGAQKSATTWIYDCLKHHPGVGLPFKKRDKKYLGSKIHLEKGDDWFFDQFDWGKDKLMGDISVDYMFDLNASIAVFKRYPQAKIIVSVRDPIDRAFSAYFWNIRKGRLPHLTVEEGLEKAIEYCQKDDRTSPYSSQYRQLIERGYYGLQIKRYLEYFPPENIMIVMFEDVRKNSQEVLCRVLKFLGLDTNFSPSNLNTKPKQNLYLRPLISLQRVAPDLLAMGKLVDKLSEVIRIMNISTQKPELSSFLESRLISHYQSHVHDLQDVIEKLPSDQQPLFSLLNSWPRYQGVKERESI